MMTRMKDDDDDDEYETLMISIAEDLWRHDN